LVLDTVAAHRISATHPSRGQPLTLTYIALPLWLAAKSLLTGPAGRRMRMHLHGR